MSSNPQNKPSTNPNQPGNQQQGKKEERPRSPEWSNARPDQKPTGNKS